MIVSDVVDVLAKRPQQRQKHLQFFYAKTFIYPFGCKAMESKKIKINIVWLKKDIRLYDHSPLKEAIEANLPILMICIFEPTLQAYPDWHIRHWQFIYHSVGQANKQLEKFKAKIHCFYEESARVFMYLSQRFAIQKVYSHQETGVKCTFDRDKQMQKMFRKNQIQWQEYQCNGVLRGQKDRSIWDESWRNYMESAIQNPDLQRLKVLDFEVEVPFYFPFPLKKQLDNYPSIYQPAGEKYAWMYLKSFIEKRGENYTRHLSKPELSRHSCSRLSPYLTWGNISTRQVYQFYQKNLKTSAFKRQLENFRSRLQWRCHFIQKFEMECRIEFAHLNQGYLDLQQPINQACLEAWFEAKTGYPLVDACMRSVCETGFLNFRMRAMLVSFLTHILWQPWQSGAYFLAQQFLDYEPGIHFSQFQMQAGVTGINTIRIYNPVKQSLEQDKEATFIKKWLPALADVPVPLAHTPWKMTQIEQKMYHCQIGEDYPAPIVNYKTATEKAATSLWNMRKENAVQKDALRILHKHVRPK